ncbi:hypothetical protein AciM339_1428 [Aciduliprofundum sp. MAR08-339]|uniref:hypothetical protein n=1 Tax=Aciduliprofundum sp. (strain MAR08-339) TaxID=673860 RepID=UPI0002A4B964|nr:hypothetical protein AciM339_1428 [Aciduliprofundum sp. MAR08-339]
MQRNKEKVILFWPTKCVDPQVVENLKNKNWKHNWTTELISYKPLSIFFIILFVITLVDMYYTPINITLQEYLLSAIFQGTAAMFGLGITGLVVGMQFLDKKYSYKSWKFLPKRNWDLEGYILAYVIALGISLNSLVLLYGIKNWIAYKIAISLEISLVITLGLYTGSRIYNILKSLDPEYFFKILNSEISERRMKNPKYIEENYKWIYSAFYETISKAINNRDEVVADEGIKTLYYVFSQYVTSFPEEPSGNSEVKERIYGEFLSQIEIYVYLSNKNRLHKVLLSLIEVLLKIDFSLFSLNKNKFSSARDYTTYKFIGDMFKGIFGADIGRDEQIFNNTYFFIDALDNISSYIITMIKCMLDGKSDESSIDWIEALLNVIKDNISVQTHHTTVIYLVEYLQTIFQHPKIINQTVAEKLVIDISDLLSEYIKSSKDEEDTITRYTIQELKNMLSKANFPIDKIPRDLLNLIE